MQKTLALFDFDHTLYSNDSLIEVTKHIVGVKKFYSGIVKLLPYLIVMKLGLANNSKIKEKYLNHFFGQTEYDSFKKATYNFSINHIDKNLNEKFSKLLKKHINNNDDVYIVSASFTEWLEPWCLKNNIKLISSKLEVSNGKITGKIDGLNCYGREKVAQIKNVINIDAYESIYVYGKGKGDREMMMLGKN